MSEWWTYRLSDLLMFSKATYFRLFELQNLALWPFQLLALGLGIALLICLVQGGARAGRIAALLLALAWLHVAWNYFVQRYATINTGAPWFAIGFALQAVLLFWLASRKKEPRLVPPIGSLGKLGLASALIALAGYPLLASLGGRPWNGAELFGLAPDPTVAFTLSALLLWRAGPLLWIVPLLWCAISTATLVELRTGQAWILPVLALLAAGARLLTAMRGRGWGS
jgi:Family of unknown function (DUF6064)